MSVRLAPLAVQDLRAARDHYASINPDLRASLLDAFEQVLERIEMFPQGAPGVDGFPGVRRARLPRFAYGVFYRSQPNGDLEILRVLHRAQNVGRLGS